MSYDTQRLWFELYMNLKEAAAKTQRSAEEVCLVRRALENHMRLRAQYKI